MGSGRLGRRWEWTPNSRYDIVPGMLSKRARRERTAGGGATKGGAAPVTPSEVPVGDVAELRSRNVELEQRNAELGQQKTALEQQKAALERQKADLERENERLRKENAQLRAAAAAGEAQLRDLRAQLGQNSRNSSRPPSSDAPSVPRRMQRRRGPRRQHGGQPGHPGHSHPLVPPEQVDRVVPCYPEQCRHCQAPLSPGECAEVGAPLSRQVHDVEIRRRVTQYDQHRLVCGQCGESTLAALPPEAAHGQYGPALTALIAVLSGVSQLARREVARLCRELFGVAVSVGSVQKLCEQASAAVAAPVEALGAAIRQQAVVGMDETGWRVKHKLRYLWVAWSAIGSIYKIGTRAAKVGQSLLGADFAGCVMTDRYKGHDWIRRERRQLCWSHLDRDAQALIDLGKAAAAYGKGIHRAAVAVFHAWRDFQQAGEGPEAREALQAALYPAQQALRPLLLQGSRSRTRKVVNLCKAMAERWDSLWLFCYEDGVEPTNNGSERRIRKGVQWRKKSLGTHSAEGAAFVERMLAVTDTCRQQGRSPLPYLIAAVHALRAGTPAPSLLPDGPGETAADGAPPASPPSAAGPAPDRPRSATAADLRPTTPSPDPTLTTAAPVCATGAPNPGLDRSSPPARDGAPPASLPPAAGPAPDRLRSAAPANGDSVPAADRTAPSGPALTTCSHIPAAVGTAAAPDASPPCRPRGASASRRGLGSNIDRLLLPRAASP